MPWTKLQSAIQRVGSEARDLRASGGPLTEQLRTFAAPLTVGAEDPVVLALLGHATAELVRKVRWSSLVIHVREAGTRLRVYSGLTLLAQTDLPPEPPEADGVEQRADRIAEWMRDQGLNLQELNGIAASGGIMAPVDSGTYRISTRMLDDLAAAPERHVVQLAVPVAAALARRIGPDVVATTTDPLSVDEREVPWRLTGSALIPGDVISSHALSHRAVAELAATLLGVGRQDLHLVTAHLGSAASVARHRDGRLVQVAPAFGSVPSGNGCGALPLAEVLRRLETHDVQVADLRRELGAEGGLVALAGTDDLHEFWSLLETARDPAVRAKADAVRELLVQRAAAAIAGLAAAPTPVELVVLTGGWAQEAGFSAAVIDRLPVAAPVAVVPGSLEASALAAGLLRTGASPELRLRYGQARERHAERRARETTATEVRLVPPRRPRRVEAGAPRRLDDLVQAAASTTPPTIALVGADNVEALLAIKAAIGPGHPPLARFLLVGPYAKVSQLAWELDLPLDDDLTLLVDADRPVERCVELMQAGLADTMMKGGCTTAEVLKGYLTFLKSKPDARPARRLSHVSFFDIPGRPKLLAVTDAAMNTYPDVEARFDILDNALDVLLALGFTRPKIAVISAIEKASAAVTSSMDAQTIAARYQDRADVIVEGPLSVDISLSPEVAHEKHYAGRIQGDADLLLVPDIDAGNALYKAFTVVSGASTAGAIVGGEAPVILVSRGDSSRSKLASIALAVVLTNRFKARRGS